MDKKDLIDYLPFILAFFILCLIFYDSDYNPNRIANKKIYIELIDEEIGLNSYIKIFDFNIGYVNNREIALISIFFKVTNSPDVNVFQNFYIIGIKSWVVVYLIILVCFIIYSKN